MNQLTLTGIAVGLAVDAFAVAVGTSIALAGASPRQVFRLAFHFGLFQALMPILGWVAGQQLGRLVAAWDHWIAFGLLAFIGAKALHAALGPPAARVGSDPTRGRRLVLLSLVTSFDAFAVGISLALLQVSIWYPALVIGLVAGALTALGMRAGGWLTAQFGQRIEALGGVLLIAIGVTILVHDLV